MPIQRESDESEDEVPKVEPEPPIELPKYTVSQKKLDHLAYARKRKTEIATQKEAERMQMKEEKKKLKEETIAISRGVKQVKDKNAREIIKKEIMKATQPQLTSTKEEIPIKPPSVIQEETKTEVKPVKPIRKAKKEPVPRRTRKVELVETDSINPKPFQRFGQEPVLDNSVCRRRNGEDYESEDDEPPAPKLFPPARRKPALYPFQINF